MTISPFIVTRITPQGCRAVLPAPRKRVRFGLLSLSLRSSVILAGIAYGPVPGSPAKSSRAFEWPGGLRTFGACQCFVGRIMLFQGTLVSTLKAFTEAKKDLASDLAKRTDKVHAELSFAHYHWERFSFTCGFAFKVSTAGIEASFFFGRSSVYRTGLCC